KRWGRTPTRSRWIRSSAVRARGRSAGPPRCTRSRGTPRGCSRNGGAAKPRRHLEIGRATKMRIVVFAGALALMSTPALAQTPKPADDPHAGHMMIDKAQAAPAAAQAPRNPNLPPTGDAPNDKYAEAKKQLASSPRHVDWVDIKASNGGAPIKSFVVYPERKDKAPVVIVIQEIFGLTDWIRGVADQLAKEGFIAIAPDFMSGLGPNGGGSAELGEQGSTQAIGKLTDDDKVRILNDVRAYALTIP